MADKTYRLDFALSNGAKKSVQFTAPQGPRGESGVYILADGETISDAPADANVVIDPNGSADFTGGTGDGASSWSDLAVTGYTEDAILLNPEIIYMEDAGMHVIMESIGLSAGKEYQIDYKTDVTGAKIYTCTCESVNIDGFDVLALGNTSVLGGTIASEDPFVILTNLPADSGVGTMIYALDGATSVRIIYITGPVEIISPCPSRYLGSSPLVVSFTTGTTNTGAIVVTCDDYTLTSAYIADVAKAGERPILAYLNSEFGTIVLNLAKFGNGEVVFSCVVAAPNTAPYAYCISWDDNRIEFEERNLLV